MRLSIHWITTCRAVRRLLLGLILLSIVLFAFIARASDPVSAKITSGDMFRIGDVLNCFRGIDARVVGQICRRANRRDFDYGHIAKTALVEHTVCSPVECMPIRQNNNCIVANCRTLCLAYHKTCSRRDGPSPLPKKNIQPVSGQR